jgi:hypothetical protein
MLLYLTLSGEYGNIPRCRLEFLTSGYPVDPRRYQELAAQFGCRLGENAKTVTIAELPEDLDSLPPGEVTCHHLRILEPRCVRFGGRGIVGASFLGYLDRLVEVPKSLLTGRALTRHTGLPVDSRPPTIVFFDETYFAPSTHTTR